MILYGVSARNRRTWRLGRTYALDVALAVFIFLVSVANSIAQLPTSAAPPPAKPEQTAPIDPLGRETPRGAMMGLLEYSERDDYETAARYLQPMPGEDKNLPQRAKEFRALEGKLKSNIGLLSNDPNGTVEPGLPPGQVRAGVLTVNGTTAEVILVRVNDPASGKIWLLSKETVSSIPKLYAQMKSEAPTLADRIVPAPLTSRRLLGMSLAKWLGWLLSIPISWLLAWLLTFLFSAPARIRYRLRKLPFRPIWETRHGMPLKCILAILLHCLFVYLLEPPLLYRVYYFRFMAALLMGCFLWLLSTITDRGYEQR